MISIIRTLPIKNSKISCTPTPLKYNQQIVNNILNDRSKLSRSIAGKGIGLFAKYLMQSATKSTKITPLNFTFNPLRKFCTPITPIPESPETTKTQDTVTTEESIPTSALYLGVAGLLPFTAGAMSTYYYATLVPPHLAAAGHSLFLQMTYGATVLTFIGAIHWGLAIGKYQRSDAIVPPKDWVRYSWGIVPQVIAWLSMTQNPVIGMEMLLGGFSVTCIADMVLASKGYMPAWYVKLRLPLTIGAILCLGVSYLQLL